MKLVNELLSNETINCKIEWKVLRKSNSPDVKPEAKSETNVEIPAYISKK